MPSLVKRYRIAGGDVVSRVGDLLFLRSYDTTLAQIDLSKLPPVRKKTKIKFPMTVAKLDGKRWIIHCHDYSTKPIRLPVLVSSSPLVVGRDLAKKMLGRGMMHVEAIDRRVYAHDVDADPEVLMRLGGDAFEVVDGVEKASGDTFGKAITGDGHEVLIWDGDGYEHDGERLRKTFALGASNVDWSAVPAGPGAFYYLSDRKLMLATRGKKPRSVHAKAKSIMRIAAGPSGSLLLKYADNAQRWQLGVYDGDVRGYRANKLGTQRDVLFAVEWSAKAGQIFVLTADHGMIAVEPEELGYL